MTEYNNCGGGQYFDSIREKNPLPDIVIAAGFKLRKGANGNYSSKCLFHDEKNGAAFSVYMKNGYWKWWCHGKCQFGGDVIDFVEWRDGVDKATACKTLGGEDTGSQIFTPEPRTKPRPKPPAPLSLEQEAIKVRAACRLYRDPRLQQWLADERGWKRETIEALTVEHALGWIDEWTFCDETPSAKGKDGRLIGRGTKKGKHGVYTLKNLLVFGYEFGLKLRYHRTNHPLSEDDKDNRRIRWLFGVPTIWRSKLDAFSRVPNIILTEGETDAISTMDSGLDKPCDSLNGCLVVALSSASSWKPEWASLFSGKRVLLSLDSDEAGKKAIQKVGDAIYPKAKITKFLDLDAA